MANAKLKLEDDVLFIFEEIARFRALEKEWLKTKNPPPELSEGYLWSLPHPTDRHVKYPLGRAGMARLEQLARLAADRAGIGNQVDVLTIRIPLAKSLIRRFVMERRDIDVSQIERAFSESAKLAKRALQTTTHYIPCLLMTAQSPEEFAIGPIRFLNRKAFRGVIARHLWASRAKNRKWGKSLRHVTDYYRAFGWVAEVTIKDCDAKTSERAATQAITYALDCLQLYFGPSHTSRMAVGGPAIYHDKRGKFTLENEALSISASSASTGEVGFEDDWPKFFADAEGRHLMSLFGIALELAVEPRLDRPISERFLDAVSWYGEATREKVLAARVVKYLTALERMVMTDEKDNITDLLSQRAAALCSNPREVGDFSVWHSKSQKAYGLRSKLVHGSLSQRDLRVAEGASEAHEVVRASLLNALTGFGHRGLRSGSAKRGEIAAWFDRMVACSKRAADTFAAGVKAKEPAP